jgi:hypothetical protein
MCVKDSERHFFKEDIQMSKKHIEMHKVKNTVIYHFIPTKAATIRKIENYKHTGNDLQKLGPWEDPRW